MNDAGQLQFLLDSCVPDSVGRVLLDNDLVAIFHRDVLPEKTPDEAVATTAITQRCILVTCDADMNRLAKRFGISRGSTRFEKLDMLRLCCNETQAANRVGL